MTRQQIKNLVDGLINDNSVGEIAASDVREALLAVYDTGILNAGGSGGVNLPIDSSDVLNLDTALGLISAGLYRLDPVTYDDVHSAWLLKARLYTQFLQVEALDPKVELLTHASGLGGTITFEEVLPDGSVEQKADMGWSGVQSYFAHKVGGVNDSTLVLGNGGLATLPFAPTTPTVGDQIITLSMLDNYVGIKNVVADVVGSITIPECVNAMNVGWLPFDTDVEFIITATDGLSITEVKYVSNGDTDETGLNYEFFVNQFYTVGNTPITGGGSTGTVLTGAEIKAKYELEPHAFTDTLKVKYDAYGLIKNYFNIENEHAVASLASLQDVGTYYVADSIALDFPYGTGGGTLHVLHYDYLDEKKQMFYDESSYRMFERWDLGGGFGDAGTWEETKLSAAITQGYVEVLKKANLIDLPQTFAGDVVPDNALGKDYDRYHLYSVGTHQDMVIYSGSVRDGFSPFFFHLMSTAYGDVSQNDCDSIEVAPIDKELYIHFIHGSDIPTEGLKLYITNPGDAEVELPLTVLGTTSHSIRSHYGVASDHIIEAITDASTFRLLAVHGVSADRDINYEKHIGVWQPVVTHDSIKSITNETVSLDTASTAPTKAECVTAFKLLPDFDWAKNCSFYIESLAKDKVSLVKYSSHGDVDEAGTNYKFFANQLTEVV